LIVASSFLSFSWSREESRRSEFLLARGLRFAFFMEVILFLFVFFWMMLLIFYVMRDVVAFKKLLFVFAVI
jgi:hypothetical protein